MEKSSKFQIPGSCLEKVFFLLKNSMPKSTQYKLKIGGLLMFFQNLLASCKRKCSSLKQGSMFKGYDFPCVWISKYTCSPVFYQGIKRHPCDSNVDTQVAN